MYEIISKTTKFQKQPICNVSEKYCNIFKTFKSGFVAFYRHTKTSFPSKVNNGYVDCGLRLILMVGEDNNVMRNDFPINPKPTV